MIYSIGRELVMLVHTEDQIFSLNKLYNDFLTTGKSLTEILPNETDDHSIRYMSVQHLAHYGELEMGDLEGHYLGYGMNIVKREKIFELLTNQSNLITRIRNKAKQKIFEIFMAANKQDSEFSGIVQHYFLASQNMINFDLTMNINTNQITIDDVFFTVENVAIEDPSKIYKTIIGQTL